MRGDVVAAARWLGASLVLSSAILVVGFYWVLSPRVDRPVEPERAPAETAAAVDLGRVEKLLAGSEALRIAGDDWERFWLSDQPKHLTPYRTHGGVGP